VLYVPVRPAPNTFGPLPPLPGLLP
jgi:hypothetical protein